MLGAALSILLAVSAGLAVAGCRPPDSTGFPVHMLCTFRTQKHVVINTGLGDAPETINDDPYGEGWLVKVKLSDTSEVDTLLDQKTYVSGLD